MNHGTGIQEEERERERMTENHVTRMAWHVIHSSIVERERKREMTISRNKVIATREANAYFNAFDCSTVDVARSVIRSLAAAVTL